MILRRCNKIGVSLRVEGRGEWRRRNRAKELINLFFFARYVFPPAAQVATVRVGEEKTSDLSHAILPYVRVLPSS